MAEGITLQQYAFLVFMVLVGSWILGIVINTLLPFYIALGIFFISLLYLAFKVFDTEPEIS